MPTDLQFEDYARECVRLASMTDSPELREQLLELAREWMNAVLEHEERNCPPPVRAEPAEPLRR